MRQFEHLLVGLKLDELDKTTLRYAGMIAREAESQRVSFMHVVETLEIPDGARDQYPEIKETPADVAESRMRELVDEHFEGPAKSHLRYEVGSGSPTNELLQYIPLHGIDLVIVGDAADKQDGGAVPERLARKAPCSIMIVPETSNLTVKSILVPLDFSEHSAEALRTAVAFARATGCQAISCLHTFEVPPVWFKIGLTREEFRPWMQIHVETTYRSFVKGIDFSGTHVNAEFVPDERPARVIVRTLEEGKTDLVVMGARGRTQASAILLGSVTERVIRQTHVPLLAVKKKGEGLAFLEALLAL